MPVRGVPPGFAATVKCIELMPPPLPMVTVIQLSLLVAVQLQAAPVTIDTAPFVPVDETFVLVPESE